MTYTYKKDKDAVRTIGMVAQDVEQVYPELVTYHEDQDVYHMDYGATGVVAIKAIQEQQKTIKKLQEEIETLKKENNRLSELEKRILALEKK